MSPCKERIAVWRVALVLAACLLVYLYLYTNAFRGVKTSAVFRVVEGDVKAVWNDRVGTLSYYLKLMQKDPDRTLDISALPINVGLFKANNDTPVTPTPPPPTTTTTTEVPITQPSLADLKARFLRNESEPLLTLFTSWGDSPDKRFLHNITIRNWLKLRPYVVPVVFTNESIVADECRAQGWDTMPVRVSAADGVPVLKYMYKDAMDHYNSTFFAYSNGDILYTETLVDTLLALKHSTTDLSQLLIVGQRTNVDNVTDDETATLENVTALAKARGKLFTGYAEDYFITTRAYPWKDIAEVVIGRRAYDNWLVFNARKRKQNVLDVTKTVLAVHQTTKAGNFEGHGHKNRDYNHNLLVKMYKRIKYSAGIVECVERITNYSNNGGIELQPRTVNKACKI